MPTNETTDTLCSAAARRWARRCPGLDADDLRQEALATALAAEPRYDAGRGTSRAGYLQCAVERRLTAFAIRSRAPVSHARRPGRLIGLVGLPMDGDVGDRSGPGPLAEATHRAPTPWPTPEAAAMRSEMRAAVADAFAGLEDGSLAAAVLLGDRRPADVAAAAGIAPARLFAACRRVRARLAADARLRSMWEDA